MDVSRLLAHASAVADRDQDDEEPGRMSVCHFACTGCSHRARCINLWHLAWGTAGDNAYHAVKHRAGETARKHRPTGFTSPSKQPDYNRHRKR